MLHSATTETGCEFFYCFLSDLLGTKIYASSGQLLGKCEDLIAAVGQGSPEIVGICLLGPTGRFNIYMSCTDPVALASTSSVIVDASCVTPFHSDDSHFYLRDVLYDRQIVDVNGAKVERVNDVGIQVREGRAYLAHVDVGFTGLLRRLGFEKSVLRITGIFSKRPKDRLIGWKFVQPVPETFTSPIHISLAQEQLKNLHAGELADILEDLDRHERIALVHTIGPDEAADALEEAEISVQTSIISDLDAEMAADILEEMEPAIAADVMDKLPTETQESILAAMDDEEKAQIEILVRAEEDSAASLMTVDFISSPDNCTVAGALGAIKGCADEIESITYVYCVSEEFRLSGVASIRDLILSDPETPLADIMNRRIVALSPDDDWNSIAAQFLKLRFKALPVLDENDRLLGIVTFMHSFDELLPFYSRLKG